MQLVQGQVLRITARICKKTQMRERKKTDDLTKHSVKGVLK